MRVAILDDIHHAYDQTDGVRRLRERAEVVIFDRPLTSLDEVRDFDALVANRERTRFPREVLEQLSHVRVIAQTGNHAYHIDLKAAHDLGIVVGRATGGFSVGAAELSIGLMIAAMRQIPQCDASMRQGQWPAPLGLVLHGKTLGIVGLGHVGTHVAHLASAFQMRVLAWGPSLTDERARQAGVDRVELDDLLRVSDVVSVHATLSPASRGLLDARRLGLMQPSAFLINTSRGPIVDENALVEALRAGRLAGAGLDVFDQEPLPAGHPFTTLSNVVLTSHVGWPTDAGYAGFAESASEVLLKFLDGQDVPQFREHY